MPEEAKSGFQKRKEIQEGDKKQNEGKWQLTNLFPKKGEHKTWKQTAYIIWTPVVINHLNITLIVSAKKCITQNQKEHDNSSVVYLNV